MLVYLCDDNAVGPPGKGSSCPSLEKLVVVGDCVDLSLR